jgi:ADP-ribose pyrophosphatase YjhB (NUDIX family)
MPYVGSYVWKVRQKFGPGLLLLPAASVIVAREDGAVLLMKRVDTGLWSIIGGFAEEGLGFVDTALAELEEEAGLRATKSDLTPFAVLSHPKKMRITFANGDEVQVFTQCFVVRHWQELDQIIDEEEVAELKFMQLDEITDDMLHSITREEIAAYKAYLETGDIQTQ